MGYARCVPRRVAAGGNGTVAGRCRRCPGVVGHRLVVRLHELLAELDGLEPLAQALQGGGHACAGGTVGSSPSFIAGALAHGLGRPVALVVAHVEDAQHAADELSALGVPVVEVPPAEGLDAAGVAQGLADRVAAVTRVRALAQAGQPFVVVGSIHAWMQPAPEAEALQDLSRTVEVGQRLDPDELVRWLAGAGYERVDAVEEPGQFARRGGIVDVFPATPGPGQDAPVPVRLDFFGDEVERLAEIDVQSLASVASLPEVQLMVAQAEPMARSVDLSEHCPPTAVGLVVETLEVGEQGRGYFERVTGDAGVRPVHDVLAALGRRLHALAELNQHAPAGDGAALALPLERPPLAELGVGQAEAGQVLSRLARWAGEHGARVVVPCATPGELSRLGELLAEVASADAGLAGVIEPWHAPVAHGFVWRRRGRGPLAVLPMHELLGRPPIRRRSATLRSQRAVDAFLDFAPGDYVVHADHGIARFVGLGLMSVDGAGARRGVGARRRRRDGEDLEEFLTLEFKGKARLHVPATQIDLVQKYVGGSGKPPPLSQLGGTRWKGQKQRVAESVRDLAGELLRVRAAREASPGIAYPPDTPWQKAFEADFPYEETEDQLAALQEIKRDMAGPRPMDRLVCGDVGFGKTELAIRAAFKAAEFGKQVAVLVPTTVLAEQHERTFRERFAAYPFRVEAISRYKSPGEINATLRALRKGEVDVIIGTHRLLSKDVRFADLGLVIIDEEQRFGVEHKERLLRLRTEADVLTLSATPIPRTLHMAMLGLRDISSLTTPPANRQSVVTEVMPYDAARLEHAIARELAREGQVYFVHNRVRDIHARAAQIQALAPGARIVVGHGQMPAGELEEVMLRFVRREADILVCTTIIESGIDQPSANTIIIAEADRFGLADLHQLRGRVGRSSRRAYCYLLLPEDGVLSPVARKRLAAIERYAMLGAGFKIAMRDLEIRGAGNLLGPEQSGHIAAVGYEMYCRLLEQAVGELTGQRTVTHSRIAVDVGLRGYIPEGYIPSLPRRMTAYRRLATASDLDQVRALQRDLAEAYGPPPAPVQRLLRLAELRVALAGVGVGAIAVRGPDVVLFARDPAVVLERLEGIAGTLTSLPPGVGGSSRRDGDSGEPLHEVYWRPAEPARSALALVEALCARLLPGGSKRAAAGGGGLSWVGRGR
ncbi:MAG: transcription-repair-coupling factor [Phycisphaerales bacterium]|nr:MAG: transcription-repair-coupling factor [Phycisphaerales bacterium]